jgi:hypothetical protein
MVEKRVDCIIFLHYMIAVTFTLLIIQISQLPSNSIPIFAKLQNQQELNLDCIIKGNSEPPPPFLVLHWMINGECDSTIDYFIPFYDIKAVVPFQDNFIIFLET